MTVDSSGVGDQWSLFEDLLTSFHSIDEHEEVLVFVLGHMHHLRSGGNGLGYLRNFIPHALTFV